MESLRIVFGITNSVRTDDVRRICVAKKLLERFKDGSLLKWGSHDRHTSDD